MVSVGRMKTGGGASAPLPFFAASICGRCPKTGTQDIAPFGASVGVAGQQEVARAAPPFGAQICGGCLRPG